MPTINAFIYFLMIRTGIMHVFEIMYCHVLTLSISYGQRQYMTMKWFLSDLAVLLYYRIYSNNTATGHIYSYKTTYWQEILPHI